MSSEMTPTELAHAVATVREAFDANWLAGRRPSIEAYLAASLPELRKTLLRQLLRVELEHRSRLHEHPALDEYRSRFPNDGEIIWDIFRDIPTAIAEPGPRPLPETSSEPRSIDAHASGPVIPGYEILGRLEPGGMGVVYRARHVELNRTVALKMIRTGSQAAPEERARFRLEAQAIARTAHPHIIRIHDFGECNGVPYLAMEFAEGGSLAHRLAREALSAAEAVELIETLARAVHFVHERGLIHRDLKPANILLTGDGIAKLADFGLAKRLDRDDGLTRSHAVVGTAAYMAPEQAAGDKQAMGPAADIYSLGAIFYELLTGQPPFRAQTYELTIHRVVTEEPLPPTRIRPEVAAELEAICLKCLEKEPGRRFASALALAEDLTRFRSGQPIATQALGPLEWHSRTARRAGYEIQDILGAGAQGIIYQARQLALNRTVALRMIAVRGPVEASMLSRIRSVAEAAAQLHHPNIVEVYDFGEHDGVPYIATEHTQDGSLADLVAAPPMPMDEIAALVETLARAIHHAHQRDLVLGSLRPTRALRGADGSWKIAGFGLPGMPGFSACLAPEQLSDHKRSIGPATDIYALGAILYELLGGRPPFLADSVHETLAQILSAVPEPPRRWRPDVPHDLEAICLKCLEKEPARRYPSAAALAEDLRRFRTGEVLFIADLDEPKQQQRWARRAGYEILEVLGRSASGFSYKARQVASDRVVVLRRMMARDRFVPSAKARFRHEVHILAALQHPNFVELRDQGEQNDLVYFAREFVHGPSLAEEASKALLPADTAAAMLMTLARALHTAHVRAAVHGGLNPDDIRLTPVGLLKITTFRRPRLRTAEAAAERSVSDSCRRAAYCAPEQVERGRVRIGPAADVYSLGAILYFLLSGRPVFVGSDLSKLSERIRFEAPTAPQSWQPNVPPALAHLCLRCLEKRPERRPPSAESLAEELHAYLGP